jgi:hypothetical protein
MRDSSIRVAGSIGTTGTPEADFVRVRLSTMSRLAPRRGGVRVRDVNVYVTLRIVRR